MLTTANRELAIRQIAETRERLRAEAHASGHRRRVLDRRLRYWLGVVEHAEARREAHRAS